MATSILRPRRPQEQRDRLNLWTDLSQQIEEKVPIPDISNVMRGFTQTVCHRATRALMNGEPVNNHHYRDLDMDIALSVEAAIMNRRYADLSELEEFLEHQKKTLYKLMRVDVRHSAFIKGMYIGMVPAGFFGGYFAGLWGSGAATLIGIGIHKGLGWWYGKKKVAIIETLKYNHGFTTESIKEVKA